MTSILSRPLFSGLRVKENLPQKEPAVLPISKFLQSQFLKPLTKDSVQFGSAQAFRPAAETEKTIPINIYTPEKPLSATVVRNTVLNPHSPEPDTHEIVFKVGEKLIWEPGQCIKVISNKPNNDNNGPHEAAYSIASHHDPKTQELTLFVKRLKLRDDKGNINYWGRCSNYLCDSKPGDKIKLYGPQNDTLVLPKQPNINVVAICGGTGLAPVRAMLPDRTVSTGSTLVFYGIKNQDNYAYQQELESIALDHPSSIKLFVGFSDKTTGPDHAYKDNPADQDKELPEVRNIPDVNYRWGGYITEFVKEQQELVLKEFEDPHTYFVFCGSKGMLKGVTDALEEACKASGRDWKALFSRMVSENRWRVEAA